MLHSLQIYPAFRLLMAGTLATNTAFWMYLVAVGWLALEETDSPFFVGLSGFAGGIPVLIFSLPAGVLIDRIDGRTVLLAAQAGVMVFALCFAGAIAFDLIQPWLILVLAFLYGSAMSFVFPSRTTIVPQLVDRADISNAVALNAATQNATRVIGPAVAGVLIATLGIGGTFAFAAVAANFRAVFVVPAAFTTESAVHSPTDDPVQPDSGLQGGRPEPVSERIVAARAGAHCPGDALPESDAGVRP